MKVRDIGFGRSVGNCENLMEQSGTYRIQIDFPGHERRSVECYLEKSTRIGVILL